MAWLRNMTENLLHTTGLKSPDWLTLSGPPLSAPGFNRGYSLAHSKKQIVIISSDYLPDSLREIFSSAIFN
jgi:hypothetical protein